MGSPRLLAAYWLAVFPGARRELRRWERRARSIPDPQIRQIALAKLRDEGVCAEGVAAVAMLARRDRSAVVRLCVAFEVLYDFVDGLGEQPAADPLANNRRITAAFAAALDPAVPLTDFYALHPRCDDGGYLRELIETCRSVLVTLPGFALVRAPLQRAAVRAGEAQSITHGADLAALERWAVRQWPTDQLRWWETVAASAAPLVIHALIALADSPDATARDVAATEAAYFPWVSGLLGVLDSLVDHGRDAHEGAYSLVDHYGSPQETARRVAFIAERSAEHVRLLPQEEGHRVILAGMVAMALSHHGAADATAWHIGVQARDRVDGPVGPLLALLRLRRAVLRGRLAGREAAAATGPVG